MPEENLLQFKLPTGETVEVFAVRLEDGRIVLRTKEELELMKKKEG